MASTAAVEKTEEDLRKEIEELHRQQREITERLRDPRGIRRAGVGGPRNFTANGVRQRDIIRSGNLNDRNDQPIPKRRLSSAVVKVENEEIAKDTQATQTAESIPYLEEISGSDNRRTSSLNGPIRNAGQKPAKEFAAPVSQHVPRVLPKDEDPRLVDRNKRILGQLLGTLQKFREEDTQFSGTEAYMRRSTSLQRAERRAREESERLRQQEREQIAEKRWRDLTLRARVAAKAQEKKLELLFLRWSEHHKKLCNFQSTKTEPSLYFSYNKPWEDATLIDQKEKCFVEWKSSRRAELKEYQKQIGEQYMGNAEREMERWQNARKPRMKQNNGTSMNLQETMDQELEIHRLEHGPKKRKIPSGNEDDDDDVEDINATEDDMLMDDVLGVDENGRRMEVAKPDPRNETLGSSNIEN